MLEQQLNPQSSPFGLEIVGPVNLAASDEKSASFQTDVLPSLNEWISTNLGEKVPVGDISSIALDPSKLQLGTAVDARVYFVGEGAGYHNSLGFSTDGPSLSGDNQYLIFPDASSSVSYFNPDNEGQRSYSAPMLSGDFVDIGSFEEGTQLDFFLIANGANNPRLDRT